MALKPPFECVLIANRGEIAIRVARTCRAMRIKTAAVYSDADADAPHVRACDAAVRIGPPPARESYLKIDAIIDAARSMNADALHPGYGFLSENAAFAEACAEAKITFVGPRPASMRAMGDKIAAKRTVQAAGVPIVPGYLGGDQSIETLVAEAKRIGLPVLVKAAAGGGGKGMRLVSEAREFAEAVAGAKREAQAAFGDGTVFLEKYLVKPRHIEVQILADHHGNTIHLGERECSIQRRHQKILEETPSPAVSSALRAELGEAAIRAARAVGYTNAGTVEFMLDAEGRFYFLEMNTRLQVEHPITEAATGIDLVRAQLFIAAGRPLQLQQGDIAPRGHAVEARIYAEDPENGFLPSTGTITLWRLPEGPGIRNDAGVEAKSAVTVDYDPLLAKLIAIDRTRDGALDRLRAALDEYAVGGVKTNIPFLRWLVTEPAFLKGATSTDFIERRFRPDALADQAADRRAALAAAAAWFGLDEIGAGDAWQRLGSWRHSSEPRSIAFKERPNASIIVERTAKRNGWRASDGTSTLTIAALGAGLFEMHDERDGVATRFTAWRRSDAVVVAAGQDQREFEILPPPDVATATHAGAHDAGGHAGSVRAPMTGTVIKVGAERGERVAAHQVLVVLEAMKMEHSIAAPYDGTVTALHAKAGKPVIAGEVLAEIEPA